MAYRRRALSGGTIRPLILCPGCGADRLIPLSFPQDRCAAGPEVRVRRPMAKCCACGERLFARIITRSRQPIEQGFDAE